MIHRHLLVKARGGAVPRTRDDVTLFLEGLVPAIGMEELDEPRAWRCTDEGNVGVTGIVPIMTSHSSLHAWEEAPVPFFNFDLYSCAHFSVRAVLERLRDAFSPDEIHWTLLDRDVDGPPELVEAGTWTP